MVRNMEVLEGGTVKEADDMGLVVVVDGVELYVHGRIHYMGDGDDFAELSVTYNRRGRGDPLGLFE